MPDDVYREALKRIDAAATKLDLSGLGLATLPPEIFNLSNLQHLNLSENQITEIPEALENLSNLQDLDLSGNEITEIPISLGNFDHLQALNLYRNRIKEIPEVLGNLSNLHELWLFMNQIREIPETLGNLSNLQILSLSSNQITKIPKSLGNLSNLQTVYLNHNQISAIPKSLGNLSNLTSLYLHSNQITTIPQALGNLKRLQTLNLSGNRITKIPETLGNLSNLTNLALSGNQVTAIPEALGKLKNLRKLLLHDNPGLGLPAEVLGPDQGDASLSDANTANPSEILEYCFRVRKTGRSLNEAKLILVGRGAVGKSTLVEKLIYNTFVPGKAKTEGINIERWEIPIDGDKIRLNVWDFGGQEIMHATHQFFLTERSLYLLVLNGRDGTEETDAEYWLKMIESFGANSPVIIVLNKIREHPFDLNRSGLLKKYPNIRGFVRTDCRDETGIGELHRIIASETAKIEELRVQFPGEWFAIKDYLATTEKNYLSFPEYRSLCSENGEKHLKYQEMLARYLNQLGIFLNYKDDPRLRDTHVLNPRWVTEGIYKILNSKKLEEKKGEIFLKDVSEILPEMDYPPPMDRFVFDLMKKFDLCFSFPDDDCHYLIPELLSKDEPIETADFDLEKCLNFQYRYTVLPEGLLSRFITRMHHLSEDKPRWRSGVILEFEGCQALVKADTVDKTVFVSISGDKAESRRRLLAVVRADFERIHRSIKNLNPTEMVPLPGLPKEVVSYADLIVMEREGVKDIYKVVDGTGRNYLVADLLNGVDLSKQQREPHTGHGLNLFYSYSHLDEPFLKELKNHLTILERSGAIQGWSDHQIKVGDKWEEEIMEKLNKADIILLLISSDFITSKFCYDIELQGALERQRKGEAVAVPVIVRDCHWKPADFAELQVLPDGAKAVDLWEKRDSAWRNVAEGIEKAAETLKRKRAKNEPGD